MVKRNDDMQSSSMRAGWGVLAQAGCPDIWHTLMSAGWSPVLAARRG